MGRRTKKNVFSDDEIDTIAGYLDLSADKVRAVGLFAAYKTSGWAPLRATRVVEPVDA
jgi:hypothetical protein